MLPLRGGSSPCCDDTRKRARLRVPWEKCFQVLGAKCRCCRESTWPFEIIATLVAAGMAMNIPKHPEAHANSANVVLFGLSLRLPASRCIGVCVLRRRPASICSSERIERHLAPAGRRFLEAKATRYPCGSDRRAAIDTLACLFAESCPLAPTIGGTTGTSFKLPVSLGRPQST